MHHCNCNIGIWGFTWILCKATIPHDLCCSMVCVCATLETRVSLGGLRGGVSTKRLEFKTGNEVG